MQYATLLTKVELHIVAGDGRSIAVSGMIADIQLCFFYVMTYDENCKKIRGLFKIVWLKVFIRWSNPILS